MRFRPSANSELRARRGRDFLGEIKRELEKIGRPTSLKRLDRFRDFKCIAHASA
jgi:hypothetical protein